MLHALIGAAAALAVAAPIAVLLSRRMLARSIELEKRAREAERLAHVGRLAGGLAHEIKNPLSTININLQLLEEDWARVDTPEGRRLRSKIQLLRREVRRLEEILSDFLRFAREPELQRQPCDVNELVGDVLDFIGPEAHSQGIQVRRAFAPDLPLCLLDADLMKQALLNLFVNAQQAMPDGGELMVRTARTRDGVRVDITDTGVGIPEDEIEKIFQVYYSTKKGGTGLGLPTAQRIIENHGGELRVQSEVGKGTNFQILLPQADPAALQASAAPSEAAEPAAASSETERP